MLLIDTSTERSLAAVALLDGTGEVVAVHERFADDGKRHGELLAGLVAGAVEDAGIATSDLDAVVVGAGPGPFTGLRVGIVSAAVTADLLRVPLYGVVSLDAIAASVEDRPLVVATDARRREVYWARYEADGRGTGPQVSVPAEVDRAGAAVTGGGVVRYADVLGTSIGLDHPTAAGLVQGARDRLVQGAPTETVEPLYLRRPDAVVPTGRKSTVQRSG
ncbi:tRNA (adenosine(37)-N6)-threonylcarbamoyltransferase complex dimerization subunit type 1 TsaB [Jatrophihabitans sp. YIM 134969]